MTSELRLKSWAFQSWLSKDGKQLTDCPSASITAHVIPSHDNKHIVSQTSQHLETKDAQGELEP